MKGRVISSSFQASSVSSFIIISSFDKFGHSTNICEVSIMCQALVQALSEQARRGLWPYGAYTPMEAGQITNSRQSDERISNLGLRELRVTCFD